MDFLCKYYTNPVRLAAGVSTFSDMPGFRFFCLEGTLIKAKDQFKVVSDRISVCVSFISQKTHKVAMVLLTNDPQYKEYSEGHVDINPPSTQRIFSNLSTLLLDKYSKTSNPFNIFFSGDAMTVELKPYSDEGFCELQCVLHSVAGDAIVENSAAINNILSSCVDVKEFSYAAVSPDVEKTVSVRKPRGEIYKEISRYLNKTVALVAFTEDSLVEQYIGSTGILEVLTKPDGSRSYKRIPPLTMRNYNPFCIYLTTASVEDIAREQGRSLRK